MPNKGYKPTQEHRQKLRVARLGKPLSQKQIEANNKRKGIALSEEHKKKVSDALMGHIQTEETKRKISESRKGIIFSDEHRKNIGLALTGRTYSEEYCQKMSVSLMGKNIGEKNGMWRGDNVGYRALHQWVRKRLFKPEFCEICHEKPSRELSNMTQIYNRDFKNWKYLCKPCHSKNGFCTN